MKKVLFLFVIGLIFALAACDDVIQTTTTLDDVTQTTTSLDDVTTSDGVDNIVPTLNLVGDSIVSIEKGTTFDDPGAIIIGGFNLEIDIDSNLDTSTLGEYQIKYSIMYEGVAYEVSRTIIVVEADVFDILMEITDFLIEDDSLQFNINLEDLENKLQDLTIEIYLGEDLIVSKPFTYDVSLVEFDDFLPNTTYRIVLRAKYLEGDVLKDYIGLTRDFTTGDFIQVIPELTLIGGVDVYVEQYGEFIDEGVQVSPDSDYSITSESNVDETVVGDYLVTYSIEYKGETISVSRHVHVYNFYDLFSQLDFAFEYTNLSISSVDVKVSITDIFNYVDGLKLLVEKDDVVLYEYDVINGENDFFVTELLADTEYILRVIGQYDDGSINRSIEDLYYVITTKRDTEPMISLLTEEILPFDYRASIGVFDSFESVEIVKAILYKDEIEIYSQTLTSEINEFSYNGFAPESPYRLDVLYGYYDADSNYIEKTISLSAFVSPEVPTPILIDDQVTPGSKSVSYSIDLDVTGYSDVLIRFYVYQGDEYITYADINPDDGDVLIEGLEANTDYILKVYADYYYDDYETMYYSQSINTIEFTTLETLSYSAPTVENLIIEPIYVGSQLNIKVSFDLLDPDDTIIGFTYLRLISGIYQTTKYSIQPGYNEHIFDDSFIKGNQEFELFLLTSYKTSESEDDNLYDQKPLNETFTSSVQLSVSSLNYIDTVFVGDHILLSLNIDNVSEVAIDSLMINGELYESFVFPTNPNTVYIDTGLVLEAGEKVFNLSALSVKLVDGTIYTIETKETVVVPVYEVGSYIPEDAEVRVLEVTSSVKSVLQNDQEVDESITIYVHLDNEYNLPIKSVRFFGQDFYDDAFTITNSVLSLELDLDYYSGVSRQDYKLYELIYTFQDKEISADLSGLAPASIFTYRTEDIVHINTVEDFLAIGDPLGKYYILEADLDFTGLFVSPLGTRNNPFRGVFDGNGHSLSNISMHRSYTDDTVESVYFGLFGYVQGDIIDLTLDNIDIEINASSNYALYVGALAGLSTGGVYNVSVIGDSTLVVNGFVGGYIGGMVGFLAEDAIAKDSDISIDILVDGLDIDDGQEYSSTSVHAGGLTGASTNEIYTSSSIGSITIENVIESHLFVGGLLGGASLVNHSYSSMDIWVESNYYSRIGGLVGVLYTGGSLMNTYASGDVYGTYGFAAGLVGEAQGKIYHSFSTGNVSGDDAYLGRLIAIGYDTNIYNAYKYQGTVLMSGEDIVLVGEDAYYNFSMLVAGVDEYNDINFYLNHLQWTNHFFDFSTLDVENGILPTLK